MKLYVLDFITSRFCFFLLIIQIGKNCFNVGFLGVSKGMYNADKSLFRFSIGRNAKKLNIITCKIELCGKTFTIWEKPLRCPRTEKGV